MNLEQQILPGATWNSFKIIEKLGSGGMGVVYKARQKSPERYVAIKFLHKSSFSSVAWVRFKREIKIAASLHHPGIVQVLHADLDHELPHLVMEFVDGKTLTSYIDDTTFPLKQKLLWLIDIAETVDFVHKKQIIHRDIKPSNILINKTGKVYLCDFGVARQTHIGNQRITKTGSVIGTIGYMSPEQATGNTRNINERTDIYSLGMILYEILTGEIAFANGTDLEKLFTLVTKLPISPRKINPEIPKDLEKVTLKAIAFHAKDRYPTAKLFAHDLENYIQEKKIHTKAPIRFWQKVRLYQQVTTAITAALLLFLTVIALFFLQKKGLEREIYSYLANNQFSTARKIINKAKIEEQKKLEYKKIVTEQEQEFIQTKITAREFREVYSVLRQGNYKTYYQEYAQATLVVGTEEEKLIALSQLAEQVTKLKSDKASYLLFLADFAENIGQYRYSSNYINHAINELPKLDIHLINRLLQLSFHLRSLKMFRIVKKKFPDEVRNTSWGLLIRNLLVAENGRWNGITSKFLDEKSAEQLPAFWQACRYFHLGRRLWNTHRADMTSICWIDEAKGDAFFHSRNKLIVQELQKAIQLFTKAKNLINSDSHNFAEQQLLSRIESYISAGQTELNQEKAHKILTSSNSRDDQIFLGETIVRDHIRNNENVKGYQFASEILSRFPQSANLYNLRAITQIQQNKFDSATEDARRFQTLSTSKTIPIENFVYLMCNSSLNLEKYLCIEKVAYQYVFVKNTNLYQILLQKYFEQSEFQEPTQNNSDFDSAQKIWQRIQPQISRFTMDSPLVSFWANLAAKLEEKEYLQLQKILQRAIDHHSAKKITLLQEIIKKKRRTYFTERIRHLLQLYLSLQRSDVQAFLQFPTKDLKSILRKILLNDKEELVIRYAAAKLMTSSLPSKEPFIFTLHKIAQSDSYPSNLLAFSTLRSAQIECSLPPNLLEQEIVPTDPEKPGYSKKQFLAILLAMSLHPSKKTWKSGKLIAAEEQKIAWHYYQKFMASPSQKLHIALYVNFVAYRDFFDKHQEELEEKIFQILNEDSYSPNMAIAFWAISNLELTIRLTPGRGRWGIREKATRRYWGLEKYQKVLIRLLQKDVPHDLQRQILVKFLQEEHFRSYMNRFGKFYKHASSNPFLNEFTIFIRNRFQQEQKQKNTTLTYLYMCALSCLEQVKNNKEPLFHQLSGKLPLILKVGMLSALINKKDIPYLVKFCKFLQNNSKKLLSSDKRVWSHRRFYQIAIIMSHRIYMHIPEKFSQIYQTLLMSPNDFIQTQDPTLISGATIAMMFHSNLKEYKRFQATNYKKNATSQALLMCLSLRHRKLEVSKQLYKKLRQKIPAEHRQEVYKKWHSGFFSYIFAQIKEEFSDLELDTFSQRYQLWEDRLQLMMSQLNPRQYQKWLFAYNCLIELEPHNLRWKYEKSLLLGCYFQKDRDENKPFNDNRSLLFLRTTLQNAKEDSNPFFISCLHTQVARVILAKGLSQKRQKKNLQIPFNEAYNHLQIAKKKNLLNPYVYSTQARLSYLENKGKQSNYEALMWQAYLCGARRISWLKDFAVLLVKKREMNQAEFFIRLWHKQSKYKLSQKLLRKHKLYKPLSAWSWVESLPEERSYDE